MKLNGGNIEGKKFLDDRSWHLTSNKREREQESSFLRHLARTNIFSLFVESARWSEKKPFKGVEAACSERDEICMHKGNPVTSLFYHVFLIIISFCEHFDGTLWISFHHPKKRVLGTREEELRTRANPSEKSVLFAAERSFSKFIMTCDGKAFFPRLRRIKSQATTNHLISFRPHRYAA